jgi:hypothetical protein
LRSERWNFPVRATSSAGKSKNPMFALLHDEHPHDRQFHIIPYSAPDGTGTYHRKEKAGYL